MIINERIKNTKSLTSIISEVGKLKGKKINNRKLEKLSEIIKTKFGFKSTAIFKVDIKDVPVMQIVFSEDMLNELKMSVMNKDYPLRTINSNIIIAVNQVLFDRFAVNEIVAGLMHEIGHIINIDNYKDMFRRQLLTSDNHVTQQSVEIDADSLAVYYGMSGDLMDFLNKIEEYDGISVAYRKKKITDMV